MINKKFILLTIIVLAIFLRLYKLGSAPTSLYWDEASLGYNAYSILKTARDEHGVFMPLTNFGAFGDYKPPGYIYAAVPSIFTFGLSEFAVRFPSAFFGVLTVIVTYFLAKKLFEVEFIALTSTFFLAISPWHLQFSRAAFEANMALFFSTLGIYLFLKFTKKPFYLIMSGASFVVAMYTFTGQRLFVPVIAILLAGFFSKEISKNYKTVIAAITLAAILFWPLFKFTTSTMEGRLRFDEVTIFKDLDPINNSISYRQDDNFSFFSNLIHNRRFFYSREYLINYFDAFNPAFLFTKGDVNPRLSVQSIGQLYYFDLPMLLAGVYFLFSKKQKYRFLIIGWLLISPLGQATARETPHALRMVHILPTYQLISAYGLYQLMALVKFKKVITIALIVLISASLFYYLHMYYFHYLQQYSGEWQFGYKEAIKAIAPIYNDYDRVIVTGDLGRPYIYFLFYLKYDPTKYQNNSKVTRNNLFFYNVEGFDKFLFPKVAAEYLESGRTLYVLSRNAKPTGATSITTVTDKNIPALEISALVK